MLFVWTEEYIQGEGKIETRMLVWDQNMEDSQYQSEVFGHYFTGN